MLYNSGPLLCLGHLQIRCAQAASSACNMPEVKPAHMSSVPQIISSVLNHCNKTSLRVKVHHLKPLYARSIRLSVEERALLTYWKLIAKTSGF